jgi:hypothetical protein
MTEFDEISASVEADRAIGNAKWVELLEPTVLFRVFIGGRRRGRGKRKAERTMLKKREEEEREERIEEKRREERI